MNTNRIESSVHAGADEPDHAPATAHFSLVLRIWRDARGHVWGQVVEPLADRRTPFRGETTLWRLLGERIQQARGEAAPDDQTSGDEA